MSADELSIKLTAKDEASAKLKDAKKQVADLRKEVAEAAKAGSASGDFSQYDKLKKKLYEASGEMTKLTKEQTRLSKQIQDLERGPLTAIQKVGKAWTTMSKAFNNPLIGAVSAGALTAFTKNTLDSFAKVEDASDALRATFGAQGTALINWAKKSGDALNLSQGEALAAAQTFAIFGESAGLAGDGLVTFSTTLAARAADLASYFGGTTEDAITAIGSALRGEAEPARRYGILLDDMTLKAKYFTLTGQKVTGTLTPQQKILAANAVILEQSKRAHGDVARTADSMANRMKDATQQFADFKATAGGTVAVVAGPLLAGLSGALSLFNQLPGPVRGVAVAVGLIGSAALIVTPRIIEMRANMNLAGLTATDMASKFKTAALGIKGAVLPITAAITALTFWVQAQGNAEAAAESLADSFDTLTGKATALTRQKLGEEFLKNFSVEDLKQTPFTLNEIVDAALKGGKAYDDLQARVEEYARVTLMADPLQIRWLSSLEKSVDAAYRDAQAANALAGATQYAARAADTAATSTSALAKAEEEAKRQADLLSGALDGLDQALQRRDAKRAFQKSLTDMVKKPSREAADSALRAMESYIKAFDDPKQQAAIAKSGIADFWTAVNKSGASAKTKNEYKTLLSDLERISTLMTNLGGGGAGGSTDLPIGKRAAGGPVFGPGTGTSDTAGIFALSNGEYVTRAAATARLGMDTMGVLNRADGLPADRIEAIKVAAVGASAPASLVRVPAYVQSVATDRSFHLHGDINAASGVDVQTEVMWAMQRREMIERERA